MTDNINYIGYIYKTSNLINNKIYIGKQQKSNFDAITQDLVKS